MNANYTTRTAALKTVTHDSKIITTNKLFVNRKNDNGEDEKISIDDLIKSLTAKTYLDDRGENVTANDLWGDSVTVENDTIKIGHNLLSGNSYCSKHGLTNVNASDNKIQSDGFLANIQFESLADGTNMFSNLDEVTLDCNLDKLEIGDSMFAGSNIKRDNLDLPNLKHGYQMYYNTVLPSNVYSKTLDNLISGNCMFNFAQNLGYFLCNIPYCCSGYKMFSDTDLCEFRGATTYLYDGRYMFSNTNLKELTTDFTSLVSGLGMFENTDLSITAVERIAKSIPSLIKTTLLKGNEVDEENNPIYENVNIFEGGVSFDYNYPVWDENKKKTINSPQPLVIHPDEIGIMTIIWKNPGNISPADALIIEREYFKLMNLKGWTVVSNLRDNENATHFTREINGNISTGTLVVGPKASKWIETSIN